MELAPGYLPAAYDIVRKAGGLCIADEVQTGFGRTGSSYWGFQNQGVTPDIVTLAKVSNVRPYIDRSFSTGVTLSAQSRISNSLIGLSLLFFHYYVTFEWLVRAVCSGLKKSACQCHHTLPCCITLVLFQGIGNGLPLAAVVTTPEIAQVLSQRLHFNTYGGNPVCSAAGHAVLEVLDKEKRQEHCATVGDHLLHRLRALQEKHDSKCLQETSSLSIPRTCLFRIFLICSAATEAMWKLCRVVESCFAHEVNCIDLACRVYAVVDRFLIC